MSIRKQLKCLETIGIEEQEPVATEESGNVKQNETEAENNVELNQIVEVENVVTENVSLLRQLLDLTNKYPSDPVYLENKSFTPELIRLLLQFGPCQPGKDGVYEYPPTGVPKRNGTIKSYRTVKQRNVSG